MVSAIDVSNLTKKLGDRNVIDQLSFRVESKEFVVVVGSSGAGKTTLLRLLAGLAQPDSGAITFDGRTVLHIPANERPVRMMFQESVLYDHLSVRRNAYLGLQHREFDNGKKMDRDKYVENLADRLGINRLLDRKPRSLSGGERQRAALLRAYVGAHDIMLLDEPIKSALEPDLRRSIAKLIREIHEERNLTTLYVTHDHEEAAFLADKVLVLAPDHCGLFSPNEIYSNPGRIEHAHLFGSGEELNVEIHTDNKRFQTIDGLIAEFTTPIQVPKTNQLPYRLLCRPGSISIVSGGEMKLISQRHSAQGSIIVVERYSGAPDKSKRFSLLVRNEQSLVGDDVTIQVDRERCLFFDNNGDRLEHVG